MANEVEIEIVVSEDDPEVVRCVQYLIMRSERKTMEECAVAFGYAARRASMYNLVKRWKESGVYKKAQELYAGAQHEDIRGAIHEIMKDWPIVLARVLRTAKSGKSDRTSLEAAAWLEQNVVRPELAKQGDTGAAESDYARRGQIDNPTILTLPPAPKKT